MANKTKKPASRGFVNNIILESLLYGDKYGYEIIKEVEEKSNGKIVLKQPSLYSSLKRFEAKGFITSYWGDSDIGGRRHYYTITEMGRNFFKQQNQNVDINLQDIDLDEQSEENEKNSNLTIDELLPKEDSKEMEQLNPNKVTLLQVENEKEQELTEVESVASSVQEVVSVDVDSPDYDIFSILEKPDTTPTQSTVHTETKEELKVSSTEKLQPSEHGIQFNMFNEGEKAENTLEEITVDKEKLQELKQLGEKTEGENKKSDATEEPQKTIPLIKEREQEYFSWEDLKRKLSTTINEEAKRLNDNEGFAEKANEHSEKETVKFSESEDKEVENPTLTEANTQNNEDTALLDEQEIENKNEFSSIKNELKVIIDEFGILKSSHDTLPKKPKQIIDNVKDRIDVSDPVDTLKRKKDNKKQKADDQQLHNAEPVKEFAEQEKVISEKLSHAVKSKGKKIDSINYKDILGDLLVDESEIKQHARKLDNTTLEESLDEPVEAYEYINTNKKIKSASLTSLQDTLKEEGFKFKPYQSEISEKEKSYDFLLINKAKLYFGIAVFLLSTLQTTAFLIVLNYVEYNFLTIDFILIIAVYALSGIVLLLAMLPYLTNPKKRKLSNFDFNSTMLYSVVTFIALIILTYAVNSFFNLSLQNIGSYLVTLILPIIMAFNLITAPIIYKLILNNKSLY